METSPSTKGLIVKALNRCMIFVGYQKEDNQLLVVCGELTQCWLSLILEIFTGKRKCKNIINAEETANL